MALETHLTLESQGFNVVPDFYVGAREQNSGPQACPESILPSDSTP